MSDELEKAAKKYAEADLPKTNNTNFLLFAEILQTLAFKAGAHWERERAKVLVDALELISKNKTEDCDIYTMGCDCDEEAIKALATYRGKK